MSSAGNHLLFVPKPSGYELVERDGEAPKAGSEVELEEGARYTVIKIGPSPLPDDGRACAYLQAA
jgi:hypothetical protein